MRTPGRIHARSVPALGALVVLAVCSPGPAVPAEIAGPQIHSWFWAVDVEVLTSTAEGQGAVVEAAVSEEPLRFRFERDQDAWKIAGLLTDEGILDHAGAQAYWLDLVRTPRRLTLAEVVAHRPAAPLEVVVTDLEVASIAEETIELVATGGAPERLVVRGRHLDNLPVAVGDSVELQTQTLARADDHWVPERQQIPGELLAHLEPLDVTFLQLLKLRLPDKVIPIPYNIPDMATHEHGGQR